MEIIIAATRLVAIMYVSSFLETYIFHLVSETLGCLTHFWPKQNLCYLQSTITVDAFDLFIGCLNILAVQEKG